MNKNKVYAKLDMLGVLNKKYQGDFSYKICFSSFFPMSFDAMGTPISYSILRQKKKVCF
jgi:hypothetical protein